MAQSIIAVASDGITPLDALPILNATSGNVANASAVATLAAVANKTNYVTGFDITGTGATVGLAVTATLAGLAGATLNYTVAAAVGALVSNSPMTVTFSPPLPASAVGVAVTLTLPALGAGNTNACVNLRGYAK